MAVIKVYYNHYNVFSFLEKCCVYSHARENVPNNGGKKNLLLIYLNCMWKPSHKIFCLYD